MRGEEAVRRLMWGRWKEGSCVVDNRLSLKSGDNAESHLPGLREGAGWLGRGKAGREARPDCLQKL